MHREFRSYYTIKFYFLLEKREDKNHHYGYREKNGNSYLTGNGCHNQRDILQLEAFSIDTAAYYTHSLIKGTLSSFSHML